MQLCRLCFVLIRRSETFQLLQWGLLPGLNSVISLPSWLLFGQQRARARVFGFLLQNFCFICYALKLVEVLHGSLLRTRLVRCETRDDLLLLVALHLRANLAGSSSSGDSQDSVGRYIGHGDVVRSLRLLLPLLVALVMNLPVVQCHVLMIL